MAKGLALTATGMLAAGLTGCFGGAGAFICSTADQCDARSGGKCEPDGLCSYADSSCTVNGQRYGENSGDNSNKCVGETGGGDGGMDGPRQVCYGASTGILRPCFQTPPTGNIPLPATIDTDTSGLCSTVVTSVPGDLCVIAGAMITVGEGTVAVSGAKPLVLVATGTIDISGTLDVASHRSLTAPYTTLQIGAGSGPTVGCAGGTAPGLNGGGAGGSLAGRGGMGGNSNGGAPGAIQQNIMTLRGGCSGQNGATGTPGQGGRGGGAVYLIAETEINVSGVINASGEGGHPGVTGNAGGGGGGSGGMIVLDSQMIMNSGTIFANGASGGEGSGMMTLGSPGPEPTSAAASPESGNASNGGTGGAGGANGTQGGTANGANGQNGNGGGGGGGGVGVIKVFRDMLDSGNYSPNPS